jgi:Tol biopolymer transport system component
VTSERWRQLEELYQAARDLPASQQSALLERADPELRAAVASILAQEGARQEDGTFLERPAWEGLRSLLKTETFVTVGEQLGPYRIEQKIGQGGMGEVFRATDTRLNRSVAIKTSLVQFSERFQREARVIAALNHPHIAALYDVGTSPSGLDYLVLEYVEGPTLADLIQKGPIAPADAARIALETAEAIEAAHEKGIVHRDLKPANIKLGEGGTVKVLDFGLAKAMDEVQPAPSGEITKAGTIFGTPSYMSPEQALGGPADRRSDIWSFGVLVSEMLFGKRLFAGATTSDILAGVVRGEPDLSGIPPEWAPLLRRCLTKDVRRRLQSIGEARVMLEDGLPSPANLAFAIQPSSPSLPVAAAPKRLTLLKWAWMAASVAALGAAYFWLNRPLAPPRITGTVQVTNDGRGSGAPMLTDGTRLLFNLTGEPRQVSVKGGQSVPLSLPMQHATLADISPDRTEFLMYRRLDSEGALTSDDNFTLESLEFWVAPLLGGSPRRLGNLMATHRDWLVSGTGFPTPRRYGEWPEQQSAAVWSPDGQQLVYARDMELHLARSDGTEVRKLAAFAGYPFFVRWSPDGHRLRLSVSGRGDTAASLWEVSVDDGHVTLLLPDWDPSWYNCCGSWTADGKYFVFQSRSNIWALREKAGFLRRAIRQPFQLTTGPMAAYWPLPSLDGKRLFIAGYLARNEFLRYDLQSRRFVPELAGLSGDELEFSRDGKWVAYVTVPGGLLVRAAADGSQRLQLNSSPLAAGMPHWSPDGKQIAFQGETPGKPLRIYVVSADGGPVRQMTNGESGKYGDGDPSWSPDGASLAFCGPDRDAGGEESIHVVDLKTNHVSALPGAEGMWSPRWSPDGRFIAGLSKYPVDKLMLYDLRTRKQTLLFNQGSGCPTWSRDGESLFFVGDESGGIWRIWMRDRKSEWVWNRGNIQVAGWGWFAAAPDNSLITAREAGTDEIYALDWEAP